MVAASAAGRFDSGPGHQDSPEVTERNHLMRLIYAAGIILPLPLIVIATLLSHH